MKVNLNKLAQQVAFKEGKKEQVDIAQIKEVIAATFDVLRLAYTDEEIINAVRRRSVWDKIRRPKKV